MRVGKKETAGPYPCDENDDLCHARAETVRERHQFREEKNVVRLSQVEEFPVACRIRLGGGGELPFLNRSRGAKMQAELIILVGRTSIEGNRLRKGRERRDRGSRQPESTRIETKKSDGSSVL